MSTAHVLFRSSPLLALVGLVIYAISCERHGNQDPELHFVDWETELPAPLVESDWASQPPRRADLPALPPALSVWSKNPVDRFVAAGLAVANLEPNPPEEAHRLCRRLHFDLTGRPPTPQEITAFAAACESDQDSAIDLLISALRSGEAHQRFVEQIGAKAGTNNPRLAVNQIWHTAWGRGLTGATQPSDFATQPPTHPELLDWLAVELEENNFDYALILDLIVRSATYQQAARPSGWKHHRDPSNRYYARGPRTHLSDSQHDALLQSVAGQTISSESDHTALCRRLARQAIDSSVESGMRLDYITLRVHSRTFENQERNIVGDALAGYVKDYRAHPERAWLSVAATPQKGMEVAAVEWAAWTRIVDRVLTAEEARMK